ncbi:hypothetical protein MPTK1_3g19840 [Marchantia polymorpha subsp. ruderalis]|uniref:Uncharacterized protein n=2 Tax=Marchantia polymorpha TaxID=3197 RepID=A0AAF6B2Q0_MARPO|nr:hypothetical protein MARPO_0049s0050 [Marchantia polymorpha]BBN06284.1 hypothetical protein Mp_3g19840 [Marchantia polymorpha subsp. ruderalis]|eukprot:PTQ38759.1 hypothetical protein MARPO_0049s0050 [Marchantia polymorpha]
MVRVWLGGFRFRAHASDQLRLFGFQSVCVKAEVESSRLLDSRRVWPSVGSVAPCARTAPSAEGYMICTVGTGARVHDMPVAGQLSFECIP